MNGNRSGSRYTADGKRRSSQSHARIAHVCKCGRTVMGNGYYSHRAACADARPGDRTFIDATNTDATRPPEGASKPMRTGSEVSSGKRSVTPVGNKMPKKPVGDTTKAGSAK